MVKTPTDSSGTLLPFPWRVSKSSDDSEGVTVNVYAANGIFVETMDRNVAAFVVEHTETLAEEQAKFAALEKRLAALSAEAADLMTKKESLDLSRATVEDSLRENFRQQQALREEIGATYDK